MNIKYSLIFKINLIRNLLKAIGCETKNYITMFALENYIKQCDRSQATIFGYLREIILSCSTDIQEEITNNQPTYKLGNKVFSVSNEIQGTTLSFSHRTDLFPKPLFFKSAKEIDLEGLYTSIHKTLKN